MPKHLQEPSLSHQHNADEASGYGYVLGGRHVAASRCALPAA